MNFDSNFEQEQAQAWDTRTSGTRTVETMAWDLTLGKSPRRTHTHTLLVTTTTKGRRGMKTLSDPLRRERSDTRESLKPFHTRSSFLSLLVLPWESYFWSFLFFVPFVLTGYPFFFFLLLSSLQPRLRKPPRYHP